MAIEEIGQPLRNLFPVGESGVVEVRFTNNDIIPAGQFLTFSVSLFERGNDEGDLTQSEVGGMNANDFPGGTQTAEDLRPKELMEYFVAQVNAIPAQSTSGHPSRLQATLDYVGSLVYRMRFSYTDSGKWDDGFAPDNPFLEGPHFVRNIVLNSIEIG